jgi:hypothetical protein
MAAKPQTSHQPASTFSPDALGFEPAPRPDLNGLIVQGPGDPRLFLVDWGYKCLLENLNLFKASPKITPFDIALIPTGTNVRKDATLVQADDMKSGVYLVDTEPFPLSNTIFKRGISSMVIFERYQCGKVTAVPTIVVQGLPTGPDVQAPAPLPD